MRHGMLMVGLLALSSTFSCGAVDFGDELEPKARGRFDTTGPAYEATYLADIAAVNANWSGEQPVVNIEDAYKVNVVFDANTAVLSPTHMFNAPVTVVPYEDGDNVKDAAGNLVARGDQEIAKAFPPGQIGYAIKHHRPDHRTLRLVDGAGPDAMKEDMKLQDTHIELVVGVDRDGQAGAVTLNNPQNYQNGRFGDARYSMVFVKPNYPAYLSADQRQAFNDNIRSMMLAFNAVSEFPPGYNGGDPLAAYSTEKLLEHSKNMMLAIAGSDAERTAARAWFKDPAHQIYCAELAHVSSSAGLHLPLNAKTFVPLVGEDAWKEFARLAKEHNSGRPTPFTELNANSFAKHVVLTLADESLDPAWSYAPEAIRSAEQQKLAFRPMTMADIVEEFIRTHIPREQLGENLAPLQAGLLGKMKPGLLAAMAMDQLPATDPRRVAVEKVFEGIVKVVGTSYADYPAFRAALAPHLAAANQITGPRPGSDPGKAFFTPPSLLHVVTQGKHLGGLLGLRYVGHGLHFSLVRPRAATPPPPPAGDAELLLDKSGTVQKGKTMSYTIQVRAGATKLRVELINSSGDADLYVRKGTAPTSSTYDCRPYLDGTQPELCEVESPAAATYHVMVRGYTAASFRVKAIAE